MFSPINPAAGANPVVFPTIPPVGVVVPDTERVPVTETVPVRLVAVVTVKPGVETLVVALTTGTVNVPVKVGEAERTKFPVPVVPVVPDK